MGKKGLGSTYKPSKVKRNRKYGFRARMASKPGKRVIRSRRRKGRYILTITNETGSSAQKNKKLSRRRR